ncbi:MAG: ECF-type sigma factor, partial [Nevskiales bacterium]
GALKLDLDDVAIPAFIPQSADILALNSALDELGVADDRKCKVVELRYFGGFTEDETAQALSLSVATVRRDLRAAEAWLSARLNPGP